MQGLGDNLHQRAVIRQLLRKVDKIWLKTSWPTLYHDMGDRLVLVPSDTELRTQAKNVIRQMRMFGAKELPPGVPALRVRYSPDLVRQCGSVLGAMLTHCKLDPADDDFRLPVPWSWVKEALAVVLCQPIPKPVLLYRPLVDRREWGGGRARNADMRSYHELLMSIRDRFFVISVADLVPGQEWITSVDVHADLELHHGELSVEALIGLTKLSTMVYSGSGFAAIIGQAVGTPTVTVFGGYEKSASFSPGAKRSPYLGIDPINPCWCFSHDHNCDKRIDLVAATRRLKEFTDVAIAAHHSQKPATDPADRHDGSADALHESGGA